MLRGYLGRLERLHTADSGAQPTGGTSPATPPAAPPEGQAPAGEQQGDPPADEPPADTPPPAEGEDDEDDAEPELSLEEWQAEAGKARKQAARYRTERNAIQAKLTTAEARIAELEARPAAPAEDPATQAEARATAAERRAQVAEAAAEQGVPASLLKAFGELQAAGDEAAITAALGKLKAHLAPASRGVNPPPDGNTTAPTLDERIAQAQKDGNTALVMRLKAQKLAAASA